MKSVRAWFMRLFGVFGSGRSDREMSAELESHLQLHIDDNLRAGMTPVEARRRAIIALGGIESTREAIRDRRGIPVVESLWRDLRYAARSLRRDAMLATCAIAIIGIGAGASTTIFSVVNALWLRPLPFTEPDRLVWIANGAARNLSNQTVQVGHAVDLREQSRSFDAVAAFSPFYGAGDIRLTGTADAERVTGVPVTEGFLSLLGVRPLLGRDFVAAEYVQGAPKTAMLSHRFWQRRLGANPGVIGESITLDGAPVTVIGVLPPSFDFAAMFSPGRNADVFLPYPLSPENNRRGNTLALIGRLKPGVELAEASAETAALVERFSADAPDVEPGRRRNTFRATLTPLHEHISGSFHGTLAIVSAAVAFLMLLVSANISSLILARASARQKEAALRLALGAGRGRLVQQMLVEGLLLSASGAAIGLALAIAGTRIISGLDGTGIPLLQSVRVDGIAMLFIAGVAIVAGAGFGLLPALQASRIAPQDALTSAGRGAIGGGSRLRSAIVAGEIALMCVLLTGAGLLARSFYRVLQIDPGFTPENVVTLRVDPSRRDRPTRAARNLYFENLLDEVRSVPGVADAGLTDALPLGDNSGWRGWTVAAEERYREQDARRNASVRMVDDRYFDVMRIGMKAGRAFSSADRTASGRVAIVNESLARDVWGEADPIGRVLRTSGVNYQVIGIVHDVRYFALERETGNELYMLISQTGDYETVDLVVNSAMPAATLIPAVRAALKRADPGLPAIEFRTLGQLVDRSVFTRRVIVLLLAGFAGFGLLLASLGLYAVIAYSVSRRTQEIGVRMALGAAPVAMQGQVLAHTMKIAAIGLVIGLPAAWMAARAIQALLYGVTPSDPLTFGSVAVMVAMVAALAGFIPSRRAARVDPVVALRCD